MLRTRSYLTRPQLWYGRWSATETIFVPHIEPQAQADQQSIAVLSMRRLFAISLAVAALATVGGCWHHSRRTLRIGDQVDRPAHLDSLGTDKWIAEQRAACPGQLHFLVSHMPVFSLDGSPVPYHSPVLAVRCVRP
jgi:hypothetical protein